MRCLKDLVKQEDWLAAIMARVIQDGFIPRPNFPSKLSRELRSVLEPLPMNF